MEKLNKRRPFNKIIAPGKNPKVIWAGLGPKLVAAQY